MRIIRAVCRILFSLVFVCAGILKIIDPVGTGLIVKEYLSIIHITAADFPAICLGTGLATLEFTTGICILIGLKMRLFASIGMVLTLIFTAVTLYLAIYNPISDCGCFGQAIHLTNWQTFKKNIILLVLVTVIFIGRKKATNIASDSLQWIFVGLYAAFAVTVSVFSYIRLPQIDFTQYTIGADLSEHTDSDVPEYNTVFTYEKDGQKQEFSLENLPDSTWTFVDSRTTTVRGSETGPAPEIELPGKEGGLFIISIFDPSSVKPKLKSKIEEFIVKAEKEGVEAYIFSTEDRSDRKTLITLNRSNGGITYFYDSVIVGKWGSAALDDIDPGEIIGKDPDVMVLQKRIQEQLFISILVLSVFALAATLRLFCRIFGKNI
ncbi:MAG: DoxX family protein [Bacteroidales bacterium]|nr:DoxX family protein [Candidatus Cacconaster equifaecalis]